MPFYHTLGEIPRIKHTTFYKPDGKSLFREELVSSKGFSGIYSNVYHHFLPPALKSSKPLAPAKDISWPEAPLQYYHWDTDKQKRGGNFISARDEQLRNSSCKIDISHISEDTDLFYQNAAAAEFIFVHHGTGILYSQYGKNPFRPGDQIVIPKGTIYQLKFDHFKQNKLLVIESTAAYEIPGHYKNEYGQMTEHAPYCERDLRPPEYHPANMSTGEFKLIVKRQDQMFEHILPHHPFDVVGWDGYLYPFTFNIKNFHPKVGRIHLPPPVHQLYGNAAFVICNFVPRPFDFHESAIPAPYYHNNIDSDEVLYYVDGEFMSRKGVSAGSMTLHPGGIPHGPQPGKTEASVGMKGTEEYAVMIDTFEPLRPTRNVRNTMDIDYDKSWL